MLKPKPPIIDSGGRAIELDKNHFWSVICLLATESGYVMEKVRSKVDVDKSNQTFGLHIFCFY